MICLPSHTTHYLLPLDCSVLKSMEQDHNNARAKWLKPHPGRKVMRYQFGEILYECSNVKVCNN